MKNITVLEFKISNSLATRKLCTSADALAPVTYRHAEVSNRQVWSQLESSSNPLKPNKSRTGTQGNIRISAEHIYELGSKIDVRFLGA